MRKPTLSPETDLFDLIRRLADEYRFRIFLLDEIHYAEQYISLFESVFVLQRTFPAGTNVLKEPKILMSQPYRLLYKEYTDAIGSIRKDFCAQALTQADTSFSYLKSTRGRKGA